MSDDVLPKLLEQLEPLLLHFLVVGRVGQPEDGLHLAGHAQAGVDPDRVWLGKEPGHELLHFGVQLWLCLRAHELGVDARDDVGGDGDDADGAGVVSCVVGLVVVAAPAADSLCRVVGDTLVAHALLHTDEVPVLGQGLHDLRPDVLTRPGRHIVNHRRAHVHHFLKVHPQPVLGSLAIVRVNLERGVHANVESLLGRVHRLARGVTAGVADDLDVAPEGVHRVRDEHDVLVPRHELPLARRAADDDALNAVLDLLLQEGVVRREVEAPVLEVRGLEGRDQTRLLEVLHDLELLVVGGGGGGRAGQADSRLPLPLAAPEKGASAPHAALGHAVPVRGREAV
eukprot:CAMPEP_0197494824 /NCGR_PEP_ID=MMETSP1311-20131121/32534_1 /TAXON_ID=464262 /ORGANISM="Genus nov. species nov., Strain RCC856" /LENGTH=340 /DNA_ID=CAMNT_0043040267 /DNA_START=74 /DNA_END=1097 /DNA_ORIENTATION=+